MKKSIFSLVVGLSLVLSLALPAVTAPFAFKIRAEIPFDFMVANKKMPKGEYTIESINEAGAMIIRSVKGGKAVNFSGIKDKMTSKPKSRLAFRRYGDQYFLSRIWDGAGETVFKIEKSKAEKKLAKALKVKSGKEDEDEEVDVNDKNDK